MGVVPRPKQLPAEAIQAAEVHLVEGLIGESAAKPDGNPHCIFTFGRADCLRASVKRSSCIENLMLRVPDVLCLLFTQGAIVGMIRARSMSQTPYSRTALGYAIGFLSRDKPGHSVGEWMQWT